MADTTALEIATAIVAGYAALVATLAFAFNVFSWLRTWQTRVTVELRRMEIVSAGSAPEPAIIFDMTNHSGHRVRVTHVGLTPLRRGGDHIWIPHPLGLPAPGTFEIPPRDGRQVWIKPETLSEDADPRHRTRAQIRTSDGATPKSKRVRIRALLGD